MKEMQEFHMEAVQARVATYTYSSLGGQNHIRLVRFVANEDPEIHCSLVESNLDDEPVFEALSYTWAKQKRSRTPLTAASSFHIICDNFVFPVSENLYDAMIQLKSMNRNVPIWIDQISINQSDIAERSSQVMLMGRIFGSASTVVAWMGNTPIEDKVISLATEFSDALDKHRVENPQATEVEHVQKTTAHVLSARQILKSEVLNLGELFTSWFERVWIIQECLLARNIQLLYGSRQLSWQLVSNTLDVWAEGNRHMFRSPAIRTGSRKLFPMEAMCAAKKSLMAGNILLLEDYLAISRTNGCSDPRDHVYGLLSIPRRQQSTQITEKLEVDYTKSVAQVYTDAMRYLMNQGGSTQPLRLVGDSLSRKTLNLPSWVPDFRTDLRPSAFANVKSQSALQPADTPTFEFTDDGSVLKLRVSFLSIIEDISETLSEIENSDRMTRLLQFALRGEDMERKQSAFMLELPQALTAGTMNFEKPHLLDGYKTWLALRTLKALMKLENHPKANSLSFRGGHFEFESAHLDPADYNPESIKLLIEDVRSTCASWDFEDRLERYRRTIEESKWGETEKLIAECGWFRTEMLRILDYRRAFLTQSGCIGVGPLSTQIGDFIITVVGQPNLYVLREVKGDTCSFVGECYVPKYREPSHPTHDNLVRVINIV